LRISETSPFRILNVPVSDVRYTTAFNFKIYKHPVYISSPVKKNCLRSRGSSGSIVSDYELDDRGSIPDRGREFFF
jgi:hypothetical protein